MDRREAAAGSGNHPFASEARIAGGIRLLEGIGPYELTPELGLRITDLQSRIDAEKGLLSNLEWTILPGWFSQRTGKSRKDMLEGSVASGDRVRFIYKYYEDPVKPAMIEFVTILNNLIGVETPLALPHRLKAPGSGGMAYGLAMRLEGKKSLFETKDYDLPFSGPEVLEYLMLTRWANEIVGNLDSFPSSTSSRLTGNSDIGISL